LPEYKKRNFQLLLRNTSLIAIHPTKLDRARLWQL
jgi:hypothetical protein